MVRVTTQYDHIFLERILINLHFATVTRDKNNDSISSNQESMTIHQQKKHQKNTTKLSCHEVELGSGWGHDSQVLAFASPSWIIHSFVKFRDTSRGKQAMGSRTSKISMAHLMSPMRGGWAIPGTMRKISAKQYLKHTWMMHIRILPWYFGDLVELMEIRALMIRPNPHQQRSFWQSR